MSVVRGKVGQRPFSMFGFSGAPTKLRFRKDGVLVDENNHPVPTLTLEEWTENFRRRKAAGFKGEDHDEAAGKAII